MDEERLNRRDFLARSAVAAAATAAVTIEPAQARVIQGGEPPPPGRADAPQPITGSSCQYLSPIEVAFVEAATERLIPKDDLGPGAQECNVTLFIDHQLAGEYGRAARWYMQGPWAKGTDTQGFQSRLDPAEMYRAAIKAIDAHVGATQAGKSFAQLQSAAQDSLLSEMESGKLVLDGLDAKTFFTMLLMNTKEGMFADPIYGGNRDMAGWKMLGFPGARYDYREWVGRHGERYPLPPVGIDGRPEWGPKS